mmetsp:Transcript_3612/g.10275  ORF Transcript_3612/g.10275 Transcript_3612/m.10275 type:complete len:351 (+) Transcript_3612:57-1109(+)
MHYALSINMTVFISNLQLRAAAFQLLLSMTYLQSAASFSHSQSHSHSCRQLSKVFSSPSAVVSTDTLPSHDTEVDYSTWLVSGGKIAPWITLETAQSVAHDMHISVEEFEYKYADVEAYTSCDDEGDELHECAIIEDFFHPTKWIHLRPDIKETLGSSVTMTPSEDDVWSQPANLISLADQITTQTKAWCHNFIRSDESDSIHTRETVRFKIVPASFGLEGVEDTIREAALEMLQADDAAAFTGTFVVAAPDTVDAYSNTEELVAKLKEEDEYFFSDVVSLDAFWSFASDLESRLQDEATKYETSPHEDWEELPIGDYVSLIPFHPNYNLQDDVEAYTAPYPTVLIVRKK